MTTVVLALTAFLVLQHLRSSLLVSCVGLRIRVKQFRVCTLHHLAVSVCYLNFHFVDVIFKVSFFEIAIREDHSPVTVLDAPNPFALVATSISPVHFTISVAFVVLIFALINVSTSPDELAKATFSVIKIVSFITI